ncbi:N-6 DNA methylase [Defluviimonas aestuarii]|uniref:Eco57I restriction-modification methylase domain-containing protein n=1 Tax=Albidovulum aestuarii TaxID=1130726 RepID=UPI00249C051A|nr:DNA methyltransferase [Defluviimonas aestuarii]MDI3334813.1 N-6 DNA methylase [Defluviimonas aestuarii]
MVSEINRDPDLEWLDHIQPVGLVIAPSVLKELGLTPLHQSPIATGAIAELLNSDSDGPAILDPWAFAEQVLGWEARHTAGTADGPEIPDQLIVRLPEHSTTLSPHWAVAELGEADQPWQLLVRIEDAGIDPDTRSQLDGWEATPHQRFERLLRDTGVFAGVMITDKVIRLVYAPRGETSGHLSFPIRPLATVAGRPMLAGLKLVLDRFRLFSDADERRLPALLKKSRDAQASVSTELAGQVLGALHDLLRGLHAADPDLTRELARSRPEHLYEGLLTVLMRLVFILYAEDRDLLPSRSDGRARSIYETSYSVRGLFARLAEEAALNPDTMDERRGGWGQLLALFRLIHGGHPTHFVQARGGKLFDPDEFPFLEGRSDVDEDSRVLQVSDGCILRILEGLMTLKLRGQERERLSYRTLDVEQIGSVYETVMGFTVEEAPCRVLAIKAGKNNKTPVFVGLDDLLSKKGKDRIKDLKENVGRSLTAAQAKPIEAAITVEDLAAALDNIVDERGSPRHVVAAAGTPILQPTDERRRTGSHYTPRSLTAPIVAHALEPAFERLGPDATPEQVLDLKVCDPAMGSGAFLVEACRAIASRLVDAWARWPDARPKIPADEDEELHARRLVAQRCLYGVDRNARAVDLARLSLWLATLAKDQEFTFLDHALKCGDSLVGLTPEQIAAANWDASKPGLPLLRPLVAERVAEADRARAEIRSAPDDTMRAIQEKRHKHVETRLSPVRLLGDAVIAAFFSADKAKAREKARADAESWFSGRPARWDMLGDSANALRKGERGIPPFHWAIEFPEVFKRENGGFDAIVGNPPFMGGRNISGSLGKNYLAWLFENNAEAGGQTDLVAYFFRAAFRLLRDGGSLGLISTNTISQGDTRRSGLTWICKHGGNIYNVVKRYTWPGEAAVVVSIVHLAKNNVPRTRNLDGRSVENITSYLVHTGTSDEPQKLAESVGIAFKGQEPYGKGFQFADGEPDASSISEMHSLIERDPKNGERIFPYIGGAEVLGSPTHAYSRYIISFDEMTEVEAKRWPDLFKICEEKVASERSNKAKEVAAWPFWTFWRTRAEMRSAKRGMERVLFHPFTSAHLAFSFLPSDYIVASPHIVIALEGFGSFAVLQARIHEVWARFFSSSMKDDLRYAPSDCFRTFAFPEGFKLSSTLENSGQAYYAFRAELMIKRDEGLTKTYNRFHDRGQNAPDIARLRDLRAEMDAAVLRAYGWDDLADRAQPEFIEQDADEGKQAKTRFDWPSEFKDEVLARLLALNAERAAAERAAGLTASDEDDDEDDEGEAA